MVEWTEKYRPSRIDDIIGNDKARKDLRKWADSWASGIPPKRAVVLIGDPGIGKTTAALALANEMGWQVVEMNASDQRTGEAIKAVAALGSLGETFTDEGDFVRSGDGRRKLIVLDEADNIFGKEDLGGVKAIGQMLLTTKQPVILIVNDWYELKRRSSVVETNALQIKFSRPRGRDIALLLRDIARSEGIQVGDDTLMKLADRSDGDVRSAVKDLQSLSEGRDRIEFKDIVAVGERDFSTNVFGAVETIFETESCQKSRMALAGLDDNPDSLILWMDHNIPIAYRDPRDRHAAFEALSRADIFLGRVRNRGYYGFWGYANDMMSCGVSMAKSKPYSKSARLGFPMWLIMMSRSKRARELRDGVASKVSRMAHTGLKSCTQDVLPHFKQLYAQDQEFRLTMTRRLSLAEEEIGFLLDAKPDSHTVRHVLDAIRKVDQASREAPREEESEAEEAPQQAAPPEGQKNDEPRPQKSLMDFG
jgi:replication factor C large subunit